MTKIDNDILIQKLEILQKELEARGYFKSVNFDEHKKKSYTFVVYTLQQFLHNYNLDEIIDDITEGGGDNCIDIFNIETDAGNSKIEVNIFQCKYRTEKKLDSTIGENDVSLFLDRVQKLVFENNTENLDINEKLKSQLEKFKDIVKSARTSDIEVNLYLVTNGADINEKERKCLNTFKKKFSHVNEVEVINDYSFFVQKKHSENKTIQLTVDDEILKMNKDINTCIVSFKAIELVKLYEEFHDRILEKNVRGLLKSKLNETIAESLIEHPKMFWYKNNGLSIVCKRWESQTIAGNYTLLIEDPYIVNGGQTTKTIYNLSKKSVTPEDDKPFYDAHVLARIYQTTDKNQISQIVMGTNNQNKITAYDLKSIDETLQKVKEYFSNYGISLLIERNFEEKKLEKAINSDLLLQLYCSSYLGIPHEAKISKSKLIEDNFDRVFSTTDVHEKTLRIFEIYEYVKDKNRVKKQLHIKHSLFSILFAMFLIEPKIKTEDLESILPNTYEKAIKVIDLVVKLEQTYESYSHHNFFKSELSTIKIKDKVKAMQEKSQL